MPLTSTAVHLHALLVLEAFLTAFATRLFLLASGLVGGRDQETYRQYVGFLVDASAPLLGAAALAAASAHATDFAPAAIAHVAVVLITAAATSLLPRGREHLRATLLVAMTPLRMSRRPAPREILGKAVLFAGASTGALVCSVLSVAIGEHTSSLATVAGCLAFFAFERVAKSRRASALHSSIASKKAGGYYYAHEKRREGKAAAGGSEKKAVPTTATKTSKTNTSGSSSSSSSSSSSNGATTKKGGAASPQSPHRDPVAVGADCPLLKEAREERLKTGRVKGGRTLISTYSWSDTLKRVKVEFEAKAGSNVELHNTATRVEVTVRAPTSTDGGGDGGEERGAESVLVMSQLSGRISALSHRWSKSGKRVVLLLQKEDWTPWTTLLAETLPNGL